jgi:hypothetical protein
MSKIAKDARKFLKAHLETLGATVVDRDRFGCRWQLPDGYRVYVSDSVRMGTAKQYLREAQDRLGRTSGPWEPGLKTSGHPTLDLEKVVASEHAKERLHLMQRQHPIDLRDVLYALKLPERVLWSPKHESWAWVRGDIAVPISFTPSGSQVIRTVLWASEELWQSNPRPETKR